MAVHSYSIEALKAAVAKFIRGEVQGHDNRFAPSCAQLAQEVKAREEMIVLKRKLAETPKIAPPEHDASPPVSKEKFAEWRNAFLKGPEALEAFCIEHNINTKKAG